MRIIVGTFFCLSIVSLLISEVFLCHVARSWRKHEKCEKRLRSLLREIAIVHHNGDGCISRVAIERQVDAMLAITAAILSRDIEDTGPSRRLFFWPWWPWHPQGYEPTPWHFGVGIGGGVYAGWGADGPIFTSGINAGINHNWGGYPQERVVYGGAMHVSQVPTSRPPAPAPTTTTTTTTTVAPPTTTTALPFPPEMLPYITGTYPPMVEYTTDVFPPSTSPAPPYDGPSAVGYEDTANHVIGFPRLTGSATNGIPHPSTYPAYPQFVGNPPVYSPNWSSGQNAPNLNQPPANPSNSIYGQNVYYDPATQTYVVGSPSNENPNNYLWNYNPQGNANNGGLTPMVNYQPSVEKQHEFYWDPWHPNHQFYWDHHTGYWRPRSASKQMDDSPMPVKKSFSEVSVRKRPTDNNIDRFGYSAEQHARKAHEPPRRNHRARKNS